MMAKRRSHAIDILHPSSTILVEASPEMRQYFPMGPNSNALSHERMRLLRMNIASTTVEQQKHSTTANQHFIGVANSETHAPPEQNLISESQQLLQTPKNRNKILSSVDTNVPISSVQYRPTATFRAQSIVQSIPQQLAPGIQPQQPQQQHFIVVQQHQQQNALSLTTGMGGGGGGHLQMASAQQLSAVIGAGGEQLPPPTIINQQQPFIPQQKHHQQQLPPLFPNNHISSALKRKRHAIAEIEHRLNKKERLSVAVDVDKAVHLDSRALFSLLDVERSTYVDAMDIHRQQQPQNFVTNTQPNPAPRKENILNVGACSVSIGNKINAERAQKVEGTTEHLRSEAVVWLSEVCTDENCDAVVFPLAIAFMDRVLAAKFVPRRNRQALASACLLLATKMKAPIPISADRIVFFTDGGVRLEELLDWEMLVLNQLQWNLTQPTALEFFDQMMVRAPVLENLRGAFISTLHRMLPEIVLATLLPSWQASACLLYTAFRSRKRHLIAESEQCIRRHIGIEPKQLLPFIRCIEKVVEPLQQSPLTGTPVPPEPQHVQQPIAPPSIPPPPSTVTTGTRTSSKENSPEQNPAKRIHLTEDDKSIETCGGKSEPLNFSIKKETFAVAEEIMEAQEEFIITEKDAVGEPFQMAPSATDFQFGTDLFDVAHFFQPKPHPQQEQNLYASGTSPEQDQKPSSNALSPSNIDTNAVGGHSEAVQITQQQQKAVAMPEDESNSRSSTTTSTSTDSAGTNRLLGDSGFFSGPGEQTPARLPGEDHHLKALTGGALTIEKIQIRCGRADFGPLFEPLRE